MCKTSLDECGFLETPCIPCSKINVCVTRVAAKQQKPVNQKMEAQFSKAKAGQ